MAESSSEKTENATPKKLREARKKGQVPRSNDVPSAFIMLVAAIYFWIAGKWMFENLVELFIAIPQLQQLPFSQALTVSTNLVVKLIVGSLLLPFIILMALSGMFGNILQFGFIFAFDPIMPKLSKISFTSGFTRLFSAKQFVTTVLSLVKTIVIAIALLLAVREGLSELLEEIGQCNVPCQVAIITDLFMLLMMMVIPLIIVMAILDYIFQKAQFEKEQKMTKEEVKREMKDMFGDPDVRGARDGIRRELNEQDIAARIKTARIVIIDIGLAIALHYEQDVTPLPLVVAIGKDAMARKMVEIAQIEKVAVVSDAKLAADLLEESKIDQYIPTSTIDRVAQAMRKTSG